MSPGRRKMKRSIKDWTISIIKVFFPSNFSEKYKYLGSVWFSDRESEYFNAMLPLILLMDYRAKPWWCPRWFLRFLHLFGNDNSVVRVRNRAMHNLFRKITKGIFLFDWKTKWESYDLRISISGDDSMANLAMCIERDFYERGLKKWLLKKLEDVDKNEYPYKEWWDSSKLTKVYTKFVNDCATKKYYDEKNKEQ